MDSLVSTQDASSGALYRTAGVFLLKNVHSLWCVLLWAAQNLSSLQWQIQLQEMPQQLLPTSSTMLSTHPLTHLTNLSWSKRM